MSDEAERWRRVEALVDGALDLAPADRPAFLRVIEQDDAALAEEVAAILRAGIAEGGVLAEPLDAFGAALMAAVAHEEVGAGGPAAGRIGPYRIVCEIGAGGMGTVFRAERDDGEFSRTVALKLVRRGLHHDPRMVRRFREERQILAQLQHPHIARLLDGGITTDGLPYFAMELVPGQPINAYCATHRLAVEERLRLFTLVCDAVEYAHRRGVIHRDLKPSNILVTSDGTPRLLDFGIARLAAIDHDAAAGLTRTGERILTPEYASPEQVRGELASAGSDVYALGVLLYELLTGELPFPRRERTTHELERAILEDDPTRPSTVVTRRAAGHVDHDTALGRRLRGDLDAIILKALAKERERRYATVEALAEDVRRHLAGLPVRARGGERIYAARRFVRRHRVAAFVALSIISLGTSAALMVESRKSAPSLTAGTTRRVAFEDALELDPALSPDGARVAFTREVDGWLRIRIIDVATGRVTPLTDDTGSHQRTPRWSPDGSRIAFYADLRIHIVELATGRIETVAPREGAAWVAYPAWSPDGRELAYVESNTVVARDMASGAVRTITHGDEPHTPAWSPDGRWIAFAQTNPAFLYGVEAGTTNLGNLAPSSIWLVSARGGTPVQVVSAHALNTSPTWLGRDLLFVSNRDGARDIYRTRIGDDGRADSPQRITTGLEAHSVAAAHSGTDIVYSVFRSVANVWALPLGGGAADMVPVTTGTQSVEGLSVSPDGRWLAFDSDRNGNQDIFIVALDGGDPVPLTRSPADDFMPAWSPDGREIVYYTFTGHGRSLRVVPASGGTPEPVTDAVREQRFPGWSPDGRALVFETARNDTFSVSVIERRGRGWGEPRALPVIGAAPRWSPDGASILYHNADGLWTIGVDGTGPRLLHATDRATGFRGGNAEWSVDGRYLHLKEYDAAGRARFLRVPVDGGPAVEIGRIDDPGLRSVRPELAADSSRLYFTLSKRHSDVWLMTLERR